MILPKLTKRQIEILQVLAEGLSNKEAARRLNISERGVVGHARTIYGILGVNNRTEAVVLCAGVYVDIDAARAAIIRRTGGAR